MYSFLSSRFYFNAVKSVGMKISPFQVSKLSKTSTDFKSNFGHCKRFFILSDRLDSFKVKERMCVWVDTYYVTSPNLEPT